MAFWKKNKARDDVITTSPSTSIAPEASPAAIQPPVSPAAAAPAPLGGFRSGKILRVSKFEEDADFKTIEAAIAAAAPGDTISIGMGTFIEQLQFDKPIHLEGTVSASERAGISALDFVTEQDYNVVIVPSQRETISWSQPAGSMKNLVFRMPGKDPEQNSKEQNRTMVTVTGGRLALSDCVFEGDAHWAVEARDGASVTTERCVVTKDLINGIKVASGSAVEISHSHICGADEDDSSPLGDLPKGAWTKSLSVDADCSARVSDSTLEAGVGTNSRDVRLSNCEVGMVRVYGAGHLRANDTLFRITWEDAWTTDQVSAWVNATLELSRCRFEGVGIAAISLIEQARGILTGCAFTNTFFRGITDSEIRGAAIDVSDNATASLRACRFDDMKGVAAVTVHNNARLSCERASFRGCEMEEGLIEVFAGEATLTENTFAANRAKCAVRAWQSTDVRVKGSELRDNRGAGIVGIGANSIDIANCTLTGNEGDGIWMGEGTRFSILNNTVIRNGGHGLVAIKGSHGDITGNTIRQSSKNNVGLDDESRELINTTALITRNEIEF